MNHPQSASFLRKEGGKVRCVGGVRKTFSDCSSSGVHVPVCVVGLGVSVQEAPGLLTVQCRYVMDEYSVHTGLLQVSVINHV